MRSVASVGLGVGLWDVGCEGCVFSPSLGKNAQRVPGRSPQICMRVRVVICLHSVAMRELTERKKTC